MNPDKKYMSQVSSSDNDIRFVPPAFMNTNIYEKVSFDINDNNRNLDLFPSETGMPELCYYSDDQNEGIGSGFKFNNISNNEIPTTFDALRGLDLDLNEEDLERSNSDNDVNKIYSRIERRHPGIFATLYSYRIPRPIVRVIIKRLIKLTLAYCDKNNNY